MRQTDLAMQIFIRPRDVATAEPDADGIGFDEDGRVANDFGVPGLRSFKGAGQFLPGDAIGGSSQADAAALTAVAASVEHPIPAMRLPDGGLAQAILVERTGAPQLEHRIGSELLPMHGIGRPR